jgi:predicted nucleotidyltransferase component of viral defense system
VKKILSKNQKKFLELFSKQKELTNIFYFTGGTALASFYLPYRLSEDLDFFSEQEFNIEPILIWLKSEKNKLGYINFDLNTNFNRNIIQLKYKNKKVALKLEFAYFPFPSIKKLTVKNGLKIDSVLDIAVNKLFTIYQNPRSRDFIDLFMIIKKYNYKIKDLVKKAKIKFDWHVDPIKLGTQFLKTGSVKDYPKLLIELEHKSWQDFFKTEAKKLKNNILK